jgi:uncharacterized protein YbcI
MKTEPSEMAKQIAQAVADYELKATGHAPKSVTVVIGEDTLVVTLRGALTPAETALAQSPETAARMEEFHRRLFDASSGPLRQEIERITGVPVREAAAEVQPKSGSVIKVFPSGTMVQVFMLDGDMSAGAWSGNDIPRAEKTERNP